jgi:hypothetical protein
VTRVREQLAELTPVVAAKTWLARIGWQRAGGPVRLDELPRVHA